MFGIVTHADGQGARGHAPRAARSRIRRAAWARSRAAECDRVVAAIDLAERLALPVEWVPISSGARIAMDSGTENLDATARVVRRIVTFTQAGGAIHLIVSGVNVGAQSYWDALATMLMHTRGALIMTPEASMVLTGSAALAASGSSRREDEVAIGGHERVMGPNGEAQYFAGDLLGATGCSTRTTSYTLRGAGRAPAARARDQRSARARRRRRLAVSRRPRTRLRRPSATSSTTRSNPGRKRRSRCGR